MNPNLERLAILPREPTTAATVSRKLSSMALEIPWLRCILTVGSGICTSSAVISEAHSELHVIPLREDTVDGWSRVARVKVEVGTADEVKYNLEEEEARNTQLPKGMLLSPWMKLVL